MRHVSEASLLGSEGAYGEPVYEDVLGRRKQRRDGGKREPERAPFGEWAKCVKSNRCGEAKLEDQHHPARARA